MTPALGICCDCDGPVPIGQAGTCETCGSGSVVRPFSLAHRLGKIDPFVQGAGRGPAIPAGHERRPAPLVSPWSPE